MDGGSAKSGEGVSGRKRLPEFPAKHNYYFLANLQMFFEIRMQIYSVVFGLSQQINKQKVCENN